MVKGFVALMQAGDSKPETKQLLQGLSIRQEGKTLAAALRMPEAEIQRQIQEKAAQMREQPAQQAAQPAYAPKPQPPPRREGGIRIYGLQEDPVEVPTTQQH
jgi:hypothetical protein